MPPLPEISRKNIKNTSLVTIIDDYVDKKYNISPKLKTTEEVWNDFLEICNNNNIDVPKFPIWTDWWDSDGNNTTVTKYKKGLTKKENEENILKQQKAFYKKYKKWIDSNREFYNKHKNVLEEWLTRSRKKELWLGAVRKMEWQTGENNLNMKQVLWSPRGSGVRIKKLNYSPTLVAMVSMIPIYGPKSRMLTPRECRTAIIPRKLHYHENDKIAYKQFGNE